MALLLFLPEAVSSSFRFLTISTLLEDFLLDQEKEELNATTFNTFFPSLGGHQGEGLNTPWCPPCVSPLVYGGFVLTVAGILALVGVAAAWSGHRCLVWAWSRLRQVLQGLRAPRDQAPAAEEATSEGQPEAPAEAADHPGPAADMEGERSPTPRPPLSLPLQVVYPPALSAPVPVRPTNRFRVTDL